MTDFSLRRIFYGFCLLVLAAFITLVTLTAPASAQQQGYWYYCDPSHAYYPSVTSCPVPWRRVSPNPGANGQVAPNPGVTGAIINETGIGTYRYDDYIECRSAEIPLPALGEGVHAIVPTKVGLCKKLNDNHLYAVDYAFFTNWQQRQIERAQAAEQRSKEAAMAAENAREQAQHIADLKSGRVAPKDVEECMIAKGDEVENKFNGEDALIKPDNSFRIVTGALQQFDGSTGLVTSGESGASFEVDSDTYWPNKDKTVLRGEIAIGGRYVSNNEATTVLGQSVTIVHLQAVCVMQ